MNKKNKDTGKNISEIAGDVSSSLKISAGKQDGDPSGKGIGKYLSKKKKRLSGEEYIEGILSGSRVVLGRALTLIESNKTDDNSLSASIINKCLPHSGKSVRIGITGVPGAGKSTFIESFGLYLVSQGKKVAVMAVDPSSSRSGGSLMGDKTRMERLSGEENVFIRPSSTSGFLGGVNRATREAVILTEAAGYDVILIETVGVGQSEILVHSMVDFFLLLQIAGAGDELQGIKKGIMEMADGIVVTKADGDNVMKAEMCRKEIENALHYTLNYDPDWPVPVMTVSSIENRGVSDVWNMIAEHERIMKENGRFGRKRKDQLNQWLRTAVVQNLENDFYTHPGIAEVFESYRQDVLNGKRTPSEAVSELIRIFRT